MYGHPGATNAWAAAHARQLVQEVAEGKRSPYPYLAMALWLAFPPPYAKKRRSLSISHGMAVGALSAAALAGYAVAFFSWAV